MVHNWWKRGGKVTANTARRITGISIPFGGIQWADPGPADGEHVRGFILFLEDRRVLYNPELLETESDVHRSIHDIRAECTKVLQQLGAGVFAVVPVRAIRSACRRFHNDEQMDFGLFGGWRHERDRESGFFAALGAFRATVGQQVALLAAHYDLDIEGDLAEVLPQIDEDGEQ